MLTFQQIILKLIRNKGTRPLVIPYSSLFPAEHE